jgi:hypothetical protein
MKDGDRSHIREVTLLNFKSFEKRTYRFDPAQGLKDFNGQLVDERAVFRNLLRGEVSLEPGNQKTKVSFEVSFSNGIQIQGSGEVAVKSVDAP